MKKFYNVLTISGMLMALTGLAILAYSVFELIVRNNDHTSLMVNGIASCITGHAILLIGLILEFKYLFSVNKQSSGGFGIDAKDALTVCTDSATTVAVAASVSAML